MSYGIQRNRYSLHPSSLCPMVSPADPRINVRVSDEIAVRQAGCSFVVPRQPMEASVQEMLGLYAPAPIFLFLWWPPAYLRTTMGQSVSIPNDQTRQTLRTVEL